MVSGSSPTGPAPEVQLPAPSIDHGCERFAGNIVFTQKDVHSVQLGKAALHAGIEG